MTGARAYLRGWLGMLRQMWWQGVILLVVFPLAMIHRYAERPVVTFLFFAMIGTVLWLAGAWNRWENHRVERPR